MARVRIHPPITVDELTIREYRMEDLGMLDAAIVRNREYLLPWIGPWIKDEPVGIDRRREILQGWIDTYAGGADNPVGIFVGDELVGGTGLHDRNQPGDLEIGYWVDEQRQGSRIATRASAALVDFAFGHPQVDRILIIHDLDNAKSRRVPEHLGFGEIESLAECGQRPGVTWALTRQQWSRGATRPGPWTRRSL